MVAPFTLDSLHGPSPSVPPTPADGRHSVRSHRRRRRGRRWALLLALLLLVAAAGAFVGVRLRSPDPAPAVSPVLAGTVHVPAHPVTLPWPTTGQGAIAVPSIGVNVASGPEQPVPVASLTKLMTAYVVLQDHPLTLNQPGPTITVSQADVDDYNNATVDDDSNALVTLNEQITEEQVLGGLLVHSADNYADLIARWDAGSIPAFVAKMNADAVRLGMLHSHFADASGVSAASESTASDLLKVAAPDMANAVVRVDGEDAVHHAARRRDDLDLHAVPRPAGDHRREVGLHAPRPEGVTSLGVVRMVQGQPVLLLAAVTGQQGPGVLVQAGLHGLALVDALSPLIGSTPVVAGNRVAAHVSAAGTSVDARTTSSASMLTWPGVTATRVFEPARHVSDHARRGAQVGTVVVTLGTQRVTVPVRLERDVPRPSLLQRLF